MKSVAVFCGARHGARPEYTVAARELGTEIAKRGMTLVYGGGHVGLMGEVADACLAAGGKVTGVIPDFMVARELAMQNLTELHVTDSMHTRKALMASRADAFIALPGGFGTLDELFEILTWRQVGLHGKPIGLLNTSNYYGSLLDFVSQAISDGFVGERESAFLQVAGTAAAMLDALAKAPQPVRGEWERS
ncbi:MAG: family Rossman fold protein [Proteobacteria bacterium]|nr:family Rossman fold protein [Pseudomonadota bacterium]